MGVLDVITGQLSNVVEWEEFRDDSIFWKWTNKEIKKGSRLIIRPGQDAVFLYNGKIEGIFKDEGNFDIESKIIPFLSSLKGFKFGFNSGLRAEVLFVNTKELTIKWGTKGPINIPSQQLPGGVPIRSFGTFSIKVSDYVTLIDKVAGIKQQFSVDDVKERVISILDQMLMKWIVKEGRDIFNLQINAMEIGGGIKRDVDAELSKIGISVTEFNISSFNYPEEVQKMVEKSASLNMIGDVDKYQKVSMIDAMKDSKGQNSGLGDSMAQGMGMAMTMNMMKDMMGQNQQAAPKSQPPEAKTFTCPSCRAQVSENAKFCGECGVKIERPKSSFCSECGTKVEGNSKFCPNCGSKM